MSEELPEGFKYATTEELALEMGAEPEEAKAIENQLERICGNTLKSIEVEDND